MFGSSFGQSKPAGGLFGSSTNTNTQQSGGGLFGALGQNSQQNPPQQTSGLFGALGQSTQQQPQQGGGLFGGAQSQQQQGGASGLFSGLGQNTQQQQGGGLFGALGQSTQQNQPQQSSIFGSLGQNQQSQPQQGSLFGSLGQSQQGQPQQGGLFGSLGQSQQNQQQPGGLFNQSTQQQNPTQFGSSTSLWQPNSELNHREKSVADQMDILVKKWNTNFFDCSFKYYFYNKVDENLAPFATPTQRDDIKAWEEALSKKPGPGFIPALCIGFAEIGERIKNQQLNLAAFNARLHQINTALSQILQEHETKTSIRALDARRKHVVLKQRCLALATKVQVLRNRGYAMGGDEEDLRSKLMALEKTASDPGLGARGEEIWARMLIVQERATLLRREIERSGTEAPAVMTEDASQRAKKILEDYNTQLLHLRAEIEQINQEFVNWQKEQASGSSKA